MLFKNTVNVAGVVLIVRYHARRDSAVQYEVRHISAWSNCELFFVEVNSTRFHSVFQGSPHSSCKHAYLAVPWLKGTHPLFVLLSPCSVQVATLCFANRQACMALGVLIARVESPTLRLDCAALNVDACSAIVASNAGWSPRSSSSNHACISSSSIS